VLEADRVADLTQVEALDLRQDPARGDLTREVAQEGGGILSPKFIEPASKDTRSGRYGSAVNLSAPLNLPPPLPVVPQIRTSERARMRVKTSS